VGTVKIGITLVGCVLACALTACGSSTEGPKAKETPKQSAEESKIVTRNPENGETRTYAQVRALYAGPDLDMTGIDCASFLLMQVEVAKLELPAGQAAYIKACEDGIKIRAQNLKTEKP
jgi:hypothetical protein